ncbi:hypothetical protein ACJDU8_22100 [Clostridium sp. WILCCON 0269]|uniref:RES domain-containing protein n=1 Tax=Candidatus Clostridium eludens TaxID=3381663 RepID=A0ABW8SSY5_9CLOT
MGIEELLKNEKLLLPIQVDDDKSVINKLEESLYNYLSLIKKVNELQHIIPIITRIQNNLKLAISLYLDGKTYDAYTQIESIFNDSNIKDNLLIDSFEDISYPEEYRQLYRARIGDFYEYKSYDLFHVPFDKRELIHTERYSIPGFPCLYLGGSVYVCWEELGRPELSNLYVSRYESNPQLKILDLSYTIQDFNLQNSGKGKDFQERFFITWPIICACSMKVKDRTSYRKFKTEYVIPQLILQVARNSKIDGIAYFSTNADYSKQVCKPVFINYVFPATNIKNNSDERFSKVLEGNFSLTYPLNYGLWNELTDTGKDTLENYLGFTNRRPIAINNEYRRTAKINMYKGFGPPYCETRRMRLKNV